MKAAMLIPALALAAGAAAAQAPRHTFQSVDADASGWLARAEVIGTLPGLAAGFDIADGNHDNQLTRVEFDEAMALGANMYGQGARSAEKRELFRSLDMDGDRRISRIEASWRPALAAAFADADRDGDGALGVSEFGLVSLYTLATSGGRAALPPEAGAWEAETWYRGLSAAEMLDKPVRGENGERIGDVKDIIVDHNGQITDVVVEVGGFFELGDQHIGVPWGQVKIGEDMAFVQAPLEETSPGTYSLSGRVSQGEEAPAALTSWRVNELIGDRASLSDVPSYGIVSDVIFDATGRARAVVVRRAPAWGGSGLYAYPFTGYDPVSYAYLVPYPADVVASQAPFDYALLARRSQYAGTDLAR